MREVIPATNVRAVTDRILEVRASVPRERAVLVAVSGIDGCCKGWLARQLVEELQARAVRAANINIDGWLNLTDKRFSDKHAIRFDEMFAQLVLPLRDHRSIRAETDFAEETATTYRKHIYEFADIDVIVLEGIYLLNRRCVSTMTFRYGSIAVSQRRWSAPLPAGKRGCRRQKRFAPTRRPISPPKNFIFSATILETPR